MYLKRETYTHGGQKALSVLIEHFCIKFNYDHTKLEVVAAKPQLGCRQAVDFGIMANYVKRCCGPDGSIWNIFGVLNSSNSSVGGSKIREASLNHKRIMQKHWKLNVYGRCKAGTRITEGTTFLYIYI